MRAKIKNDRKGIGGFFFDIPVLLVIIVVITVFTTSIYQVYVPIREERKRITQDRTCIELKNSVQNYQEIHAEGKEKFSMEKLEVLDEERLESHLKLDPNYDYNISLNVLERDESWSFGENAAKEEISEVDLSSYQTPVLLVDEGGSSHISKLRVSVWRG